MTAHINAQPGDFAQTVIMPGDPLRARYIAETFLEDVREVTNVRNMLGYTGYFKGQRISVMGHGMGIPSMVLYAHELVNDFGVRRIIRVGSLGATQHHVQMRDVILAQAAGTDSPTNAKRSSGYQMATSADFELLHKAFSQARQQGIPVKVGNVFSGDLYYDPDEN
ncbi:DeoD-type purine-nucleoside phosphorylase [Aeromonas sp. R6-2]